MRLVPHTLFAFSLAASAAVSPSGVPGIVQRSVITNTRDWKAQDDFAFDERDIKSKVDSDGNAKLEGSKTYAVLMIQGTPYRRLLAVDQENLSKAQQAEEQRKLEQERAHRRQESPAERQSRIKKYREQREEEHLLMDQMAIAFDFTLLGNEQVDGVECFHLRATPKAAYKPPVEKARVLRGMRGEMWIDRQAYHWVKVKAEVIEPVTFGFFIAKVNPGTRFELEQKPVGSVWLPKRFLQVVRASVFGVYGLRSRDEFLYSGYRPDVQPETGRRAEQ